jgi:hypothetical protein
LADAGTTRLEFRLRDALHLAAPHRGDAGIENVLRTAYGLATALLVGWWQEAHRTT